MSAVIAFVAAGALFVGPYRGYAWEWEAAGPPVETSYPIPYGAILALLALGGALLGWRFGVYAIAPCVMLPMLAVTWIHGEQLDDLAAAEFLPDPRTALLVMTAATSAGGLAGMVARRFTPR